MPKLYSSSRVSGKKLKPSAHRKNAKLLRKRLLQKRRKHANVVLEDTKHVHMDDFDENVPSTSRGVLDSVALEDTKRVYADELDEDSPSRGIREPLSDLTNIKQLDNFSNSSDSVLEDTENFHVDELDENLPSTSKSVVYLLSDLTNIKQLNNSSNSNDNVVLENSVDDANCSIASECSEKSYYAMEQYSSESDWDNLEIEMATNEIEKAPCFGNRFINVGHFFKQMKALKHGPTDCSINEMEIIKEKRKGLFSEFTLKCKMCNTEKVITSSEDRFLTHKFVVAGVNSGLGYTNINEICKTMELPFIASKTFQKLSSEVHETVHDLLWTTIKEAGREEAELALSLGEYNDDGVPLITVVADGAWSKRSYNVNYNASSGVACIIGLRTKRILFLGIRNKYCAYCTKHDNKDVPEHICFKNYSGPSTAMEADIILEGFRTSMEMHGLIYNRLVGDGDSSVYKQLTTHKPYGNLMVEKVECRNHLIRNFTRHITDISVKTKSNFKNLPVSVCIRDKIKANVSRMQKAIRSACLYRINEDTSFADKAKKLEADFRNIPSHIFGEHKDCDTIGYFNCQKKGEENLVPDMECCGVYQDILGALRRIILNIPSLLHNMDNNLAECYNSVVAKYVGGKRINFSQKGGYEMRCEAAAVSFNTDGHFLSNTIEAITKKPASESLKKYEDKKEHYVKSKKKYRKKVATATADHHYGIDQTDDMDDNTFQREKNLFLTKLEKSPAEIKVLEAATRSQSSNHLWRQERHLRLTASNFGTICKKRASTANANKVKEILYKNFYGNSSTMYGLKNEEIARGELEKILATKILECGLFVDEQEPYFAASPDGQIDEDTIVEIKCPATIATMTPQEGINSKKIKFATVDNGKVILKKNHNYYYQVQGQLHVTKKSKCIFCIWSPKGLEFETIYKDDNFWHANMHAKLKNFYFDSLLPELIDPRYARGLPLR